MRSIRLFALPTAAAVVAMTLAASLAGYAQDGGSPLTQMAGAWSGNGTINLSDGTRERIRCRSNYRPDGGGSSMALTLTCASDSYKFELQSNVTYANGQISGNWSEASRNAAGNLTGTARGGQIEARVEGQTFAAFLSITTRTDRQNISIRAPGSQMQEVAISLSRN